MRPAWLRACLLLPLVLLTLPAAPAARAQAPELVASTPPRTPDEEKARMHLPPGFEIELVASEPEINKPLNLNFDDRGRLWVTSTVEYPFPVKEGKPRDRVVVLDGFQPNGRATKITTFADGLNIPIGLLPLRGGREVLVHSIPNIYRLTDTDGDGQADRRDVAYAEYGARDTHGMTNSFSWGFDGWIYATHGFSNTSTVKGSDGQPITMNSGNTYRFRADGSHIEYFTHGQVNPFGLCFDPLGNLYSADCHSKPVYMLLRGAYYPSFGKPDDGLGFGPEMVQHDHGSTAIAGVVYYAADQFPEAWRGTVFIGNVVTNRINHDKVAWHGSSPQGLLQPDFLVSDDPWFRPVDIKLGPDGALYIADFYNRIIGHYEVPLTHPGRDRERGRIWRVVYRGSEPHAEPKMPTHDWTKASVPELIDGLAHANLAVRIRAANELADRSGDEVTKAVQQAADKGTEPWQRAHALWVLHRRGALGSKTLQAAASDSAAAVRVHTMRILAERSALPAPQRGLAIEALKDSDPFVERTAAEALGRHPAAENVRPLLALLHSVSDHDTHLLHTVRMALRDQLLRPSAWSELPSSINERDRKAIADVAPGVPSAEAAAYLLRHLTHVKEPDGTLVRYAHHVARYGEGDAPQRLLAFARADRPENLAYQAALLRSIVQGTQERGAKLDAEAQKWAAAVTEKLVASPHSGEAQAGFELAGVLKLPALRPAIAAAAADHGRNRDRRVAAISALVAMDAAGTVELLGQILTDATEDVAMREQAAAALARINLPNSQNELVKALPTAPSRLQVAIGIGLAGGGPLAAARLLDAVAGGKASARLLQERGVEVRLASSGVSRLHERVSELTAGLPPADQRLQELFNRRRSGLASAHTDAAAGAKVFEKHCGTCHQLRGQGAKVGPQLDGVGLRGADRLLEDLLDPSRNVDLQFRATTLALKNGQVVTGLVLREEGQVVVVADAEGKENRIAKDTIEEKKVTPLSPMPANLADQISEPDFYNLIAYLLTQQPPRTEPAH